MSEVKFEVLAAHKHSYLNRAEIEKSKNCGCFYCLRVYPSSEIIDWTDVEGTAICPYCDIDSVIGDSAGFPITKEFLKEMKDYWFNRG